jgi:hypothetical protein
MQQEKKGRKKGKGYQSFFFSYLSNKKKHMRTTCKKNENKQS